MANYAKDPRKCNPRCIFDNSKLAVPLAPRLQALALAI